MDIINEMNERLVKIIQDQLEIKKELDRIKKKSKCNNDKIMSYTRPYHKNKTI